MNYFKLGKLPDDIIDFFKNEIFKRKHNNKNYQWIHFDDFLNKKFSEIFINSELSIQKTNDPCFKLVQKVFYSNPGHGYTIHKDGIKCKSALNIVLSCNKQDWVRWYDEKHINSITTTTVNNRSQWKYGISRDTNLKNYETVEFIDELHNDVGDVYILDVDKFHSFKCIGENPRIILQTKFEGFPDITELYSKLKNKSFSCIQPY